MRTRTVILVCVLLFLPTGSLAQGIIPLEGEVPNAAAAHVTPQGFEFISDVATTTLSSFDLEGALMALNPLVEIQNCAMFIFDGTILFDSVNLDTLALELSTAPIMGMIPVPNALYARLAAYPAAGESLIVIGIDGNWGVGCTDPFNATAALTADPFEIGVSLTIDYAPGGKAMSIVVHNIKLGDDALEIAFTGLPDPSLEVLLDLLIQQAIPPLIESLAPQIINEALAEALGDIVLEGQAPVGDYTLVFAFDPAFSTSPDGFTAATDGSLYLQGTTINPCIEPAWPIGSPYTAGPLPEFDVYTPGGELYDMALVFSDDIFNQLIYSFFIKGDLCMMFPWDFDDELRLSSFAGLFPNRLPDPATEDDRYLIDIYPDDLPLVVVGEGDTDLALTADPIRLDWHLQVEQRYVTMIAADIALDLGLVLDIDEDNNLVISLDEQASLVHFDISGTEWNLLPPELIETLLNGLIDNFLMPLIGGILPDIPLPSFGGYQFVIPEIGATGPDEDFFGLYTEFVAQPPDAGAAFDLPQRGLVTGAFLGPRQSTMEGLSGPLSPVLRLADSGRDAADYFRVRVDGGMWRVVRDGELDLSWLLDGAHVVEAVAVVGRRAATRRAARLVFVLDRVAPRLDEVTVRTDGPRFMLSVEAHDFVFRPERLWVQVRTATTPWSKWRPLGDLPVPAGLDPSSVVVRVADPAGNVSHVLWADVK
ncbi:MAG: hypothetical protein P9L99_06015 [Candidatus Lernaella stagnicola]|nr:hypothetical protein [Candidatus Lernaella stagnicola]